MRNLTDEEWENIQKDLTGVFKKHGVDMKIRSEIMFVKIEENGESTRKTEEITKID